MTGISFGEKMRRARIENAWTQAELAAKLDVTAATIGNWESGKFVPALAKKSKIRDVLGLKPGDEESDDNEVEDVVGPSVFGKWLNRARIDAEMSVAELASKSNLSIPAIYAIESGRIANPRDETVASLEQALGKIVPDETKRVIHRIATVEGVGEFFEFSPHSKDEWPTCPGIYVLYDISERPIYVGQGSNIKKRIQDHEEKFWFKAPIVVTAAYIQVDDDSMRKKIETILIRFLKRNAVINKQNVER